MMKVKLLMGFAQVLSYFPVTFDSIPWPVSLVSLMKSLEIFSVDIFSLLGASACELEQGFLGKFAMHMYIVPGILGVLLVAFCVAYVAFVHCAIN